MICPPDRASVWQSLHDFLPKAPLYGRDRNHVTDGHSAVSKLSPAIRHRVISEYEVVSTVLAAHRFSRVEKFIQEVYWRRYWKSWLSLRPQVWRDYQQALLQAKSGSFAASAARIEAGDSGNVIIDHFSKELVTTGYLHNHARMWYAAWWIHQARLPWELGADFFLRHLLDADPASNTLSWRWVAGLQTPGKTYLARRSNLEKYLAPELLEKLHGGLAGFENPQPHLPAKLGKAEVTCLELPDMPVNPSLSSAWWIHEEDLSPEHSPLMSIKPKAVIVATLEGAMNEWLEMALQDVSRRIQYEIGICTSRSSPVNLADDLLEFALQSGVEQIIAMRPDIGPLDDALPEVRATLEKAGIQLGLMDRTEDLQLRPFATRGFFQFWESIRKQGIVSEQKEMELF